MKKGVELSLHYKQRIQEPFLSTIMIIVKDYATFKPEEAQNIFLEDYPDTNAHNFQTKKQFKYKLVNEK